ncbi:ABC transporter permease [Cryobacterium sp. CG_9.6]|uniref:ABC transporter permease n=1 Tax=Cryobacterium sp. CG_9.6 TaxID=2760710 RepID=UPI0024735F40|nr:ABC transporter permease [Cryobacterium sp. CG_9.6]MDH6236743.1 ABC-2 type transport system permease protein [Cryobacterium sp. CG_9.6]
MSAFAMHLGFEFRFGLRNKTLLLMNYLFPLGVYALLGALMGEINPGFLLTVIPAMSLFAIMSGALLGMPDTLVNARNAGIFRSYKINGVPALSLLTIPLITSMVHALLVTMIIAVTAPLIFGGQAIVNWGGFLLVFVVSAFALAGIGALIGVVSSNSRVTVLLSQLVFLPSMILGGLMLPVSILPTGLDTVAMLLPTSYAMDAFSALALGQVATQPWWSLAILTAGGAVAFGLAALLFSWDPRNATRRAPVAWSALAALPYVTALAVSSMSASAW